MLLRHVKVRLCDLGGKQETVVLHAARLSELLKSFRSEHFPQRIGRIYGPIDDDVSDVDALG
jgi:hypothetical protein